jgi:hypothetical protein
MARQPEKYKDAAYRCEIAGAVTGAFRQIGLEPCPLNEPHGR